MGENKIVCLLADWTDRSPAIKKAVNDLGHNSIPLLAIWPAKSEKPIILADLISQGQVLEKLREAGPSSEASSVPVSMRASAGL